MIRKWFIIGILTVVALLVLRDFYKGAILYNPIGDLQREEDNSPGKGKAADSYKYAWSEAIAQKNLFGMLRGAPPPPAVEEAVLEIPEVPAIEIPDLKLNGIIVNQYKEYVVYISKNRESLPPLRKGDRYGNLLVLDVSDKTVDLLWDEQEIRLSMEKLKKQ